MWCGSVVPARAQADPEDAKRGVARLSLMEGDVTVRRGDSGDWVAGVVNAPLMTGDQIATASNARTEIQLDPANALRVGADASVRIAQLEYDRYQFELARGTVTYRVLQPTDINIEVDTQNIAIRPSKEGIYRIHVDAAGVSEVTVRLGSVEVSTSAGSQWVNAGQTLMARGPAADPEFKVAAAIPSDDWDHWNEGRDQEELASVSAQYVPPGVTGAGDLDQNGTWQNNPDYGYVWQPNVPADWSPYSNGEWVWEDWYGWTWVGYEPWGWAPYHYGRWFYTPVIGWAWYPGARFTRHYWSPALVGFVGWGGAGFGLGYVGWVPLAPFEVMRPWWGPAYYGHPGYMNRSIGITSLSISSIYRNASVANGVVGVRGTEFQAGRFASVAHFNAAQIHDARPALGSIPIAPSAANLRFSDRTVASAPRAAAGGTQFFSREQAKPAQQIPFAQQQRSFTEARAAAAAARPAAGARSSAAPSAQRPGSASTGWRQYGDRPQEPAAQAGRSNTPAQNGAQSAQNPASRTSEAPAQQASAWQRFGAPGTESQSQPAQSGVRPAQPSAQQGATGWNRFGSPGASSNNSAQRPAQPQPAPQTYRPPQYTAPAQAPRQSAPAPAPARSSGGSSRSSGGSSHGGGGHR
jgi:hypothetical protein